MSILLNTVPGSYQSAHEDILFVAYEATKATDNATYPDYKYVLDLYVNGTFQTRQKVFPNPDNYRGIFNIGKIVRNYVGTTFNPTMSQIRAQQFGADSFYVDVQCKFGEDYDFTLYTNRTVDTTRRYFNNYIGRLTGPALSTYLDKFASNSPSVKTVRFEDTACFVPYLPSTSGDITVSITSGATTQTKTITPAKDTVELLNLSPTAINAEYAGLITSATSFYTVTIGAQQYRFNIKCNPLYDSYWIHFLNRQGAYESFPFGLVSRNTLEIERKSFGKLPYVVDSNGNVSYKTGSVYNATNRVYSVLYSEKMRLNTDMLTDGEYQWLKELIVSPETFVQIGSDFLPMSIVANNYEERKYINDGMTNLEIEIEFGKKYNSQLR